MKTEGYMKIPVKCTVSKKETKEKIEIFHTYSVDTGLKRLTRKYGSDYPQKIHFIFENDYTKKINAKGEIKNA